MVSQKYRWDFIGLSTNTKPTSETSDKVVNGSTYYCSDTSKLYVYCNGTWYERKPLGGGGGGGTSDFNDLSNRPKYNGSDMTGSTNIPEVKTYTAGSNVAISDQNVISATDTTYSDFTGTDGTAAGTAGLVPAPATTDAGKFLKADGTWDTAGGGSGGGVTELTSADYNYDYGSTGTNNCVALWLLSEGTYSWATTLRSSVRVTTTETAGDLSAGGALVIAASDATLAKVYLYGDGSATTATGRNILQMYRVNKTNGTSNVSVAAITTRELKQSTGNSQSDIMSQNAVTSMVYADPSTAVRIRIGNTNTSANNTVTIGTGTNGVSSQTCDNAVVIGWNAVCGASTAVAIGSQSKADSVGGMAIGRGARSNTEASVALGAYSSTSEVGEVNIGSTAANWGYHRNSNYRLLTGLYDPQNAHDAATKGYVDPTTDSSAPTTATVGRLGQIQIDTTTATAYMCVAVDTVTPAYTWKQITA